MATAAAVVGGWLLVALAWTPPTYWVERGQTPPGAAAPAPGQVFLEMLLFYAPWAALTPLVWRLGRAWPFVRGRLAAAGVAHLLLALAAVPTAVGLGRALGALLAWPGAPSSLQAALHGVLITSFYCLPTFVALVAIGQGRRAGEQRATRPAAREAPLRRIAVPERGRTDLVDLDEVDYVDVDGHYLCIHVGARTHLLRGTLGELEARLDPARFLRVHRSAIVRLDRIKAVSERRNGDCVLLLSSGAEVSASRSYRPRLAARLDLDRT